jgi:hypothetical protein
MMEKRAITTWSTSATTAEANTVILRDGDRRRLIFRPTLVENPNDAAASVRGTFVYQAKRVHDAWVDVEGLRLPSLRAEEWTKLELKSAEVLKLYQALQALYGIMETDGIQYGVTQFVPTGKDEILQQFSAMLQNADSKQLMEAFMEWARQQDLSSLASSLKNADSTSLINFDAAVTVARLRQFVTEATALLASSDEGAWQGLLMRESWVISQIYAEPLVVIKEQAYVGGKSLDNTGGSVVDYLYTNNVSRNALLVEIKTPAAPLLRTYRGNVMAPSTDLGGGVQQLLQARYSFEEEFRQLVARSSAHLEIVSPHCLLVVGNYSTLTDDTERRSFELFRRNARQVDVVTFDELVEKAEQLVRLLEGRT